MAFRAVPNFRVTAWPVHTRFPFPQSPSWGTTDFPTEYSMTAIAKSYGSIEGAAADFVTDVLTANRIDVPHNNHVVTQYDEDGNPIIWDPDTGDLILEEPAANYYNRDLRPHHWENLLTSPLMVRPSSDVTPWSTLTVHSAKARALVLRWQEVPEGSPDTRNSYYPEDAYWQLRTLPEYAHTFGGVTSLHNNHAQGFILRAGVNMDPRTVEWTRDENNNWQSVITYPTEGSATPEWELLIQVEGRTPEADECLATTFRVVFRLGAHEAMIYRGLGFQSDIDIDCLGWGSGPVWEEVGKLKLHAGSAHTHGTTDSGYKGYYSGFAYPETPTNIEVLLIADQLIITYGNQPPTLVSTSRSRYDSTSFRVRSVEVRGWGAKEVNYAIIPIKWATAVSYKSRRIPVGFIPSRGANISYRIRWGHLDTDGNPMHEPSSYTIGFDPDGTPNNENSSWYGGERLLYTIGDFQYRLDMSMPTHGTWESRGWTHYTPAIKAIDIEIEEVVFEQPGVPVQLYPEEIAVSQHFNREDLSIESTAKLIFNNFYDLQRVYGAIAPQAFWGEFSNYAGVFAIEIDMMFELQEPNGSVEMNTGWSRVFTGYGNIRSTTQVGGGQSKYSMDCVDRAISLKSQVWGLPWMDGWNIYYAAAHLVNRGGFKRGVPSDSDIAFREYVPPTPSLDFGNPTTEPTYFMPLGTGAAPLRRFQGGLSIWSILGHIGKEAGFLRYVDAYGRFDFRRYRLLNAEIPYRVFSIVDRQSLGNVISPRIGTEVETAIVNRDLTQVYNSVALIGVPVVGGWRENATVVNVADDGSVYAPPETRTAFDFTQGNHLGFRKQFVWTDNLWAVLDVQKNPAAYGRVVQAAQEILGVMATPANTLVLNTWLQPDITPETRIGFLDRRTGAFDVATGKYYEYMVTSVTHTISKSQARSALTCMYLPPFTNPL